MAEGKRLSIVDRLTRPIIRNRAGVKETPTHVRETEEHTTAGGTEMSDALEKARDALLRAFPIDRQLYALADFIDAKVNALLDAREAKAEPADTREAAEATECEDLLVEARSEIAQAKKYATATEALGRFGHHPDPAIDFEVEVGDIEGSAYEAIAGHLDRTALLDRAERALSFRVGAVESCINAKATLRKIVADLKAPTLAQPARDTDPVPATDAREATWEVVERFRKTLADDIQKNPHDVIAKGYVESFLYGLVVRLRREYHEARAAGITGKGTSDD